MRGPDDRLSVYLYGAPDEGGPRGDAQRGSSSSQYVLAAIKYIQFNYSHDISVDDIAKAVGVSRSHLYRVFMSNVGQSPIDYLTKLPHQRGVQPAEEFQPVDCGNRRICGLF